ncbi:MAG: 5'-3' exonuclease H3TH domain-containing protein [Chthoniobacter sp.]|uniref:5'-3' exonuclease n=1 Tax=Chthoniobacter sp. TaxID=2510640 RepID=UPI0032AE4C43
MKLLLIDGHYYVYRSFFAIRELSNSRGEPTNAIYGFVKTVRRMVKDLAPDLAAVVWDMGMPQRRVALQPAYKEQRAEMPELMRPQLTFIQNLVPMLGFASLWLPDTEADDLMASYAVAARARGDDVVLATNDKDLFQLVNGNVKVYSTNKTDLAAPSDTFALLGNESVRKKWNVEPGQIGDVLALIGDNVDNIPGVDGIGPKGAATLLNAHGSLDALLADLDAVKNERVREKLKAARAQIEQNREMVRLDLDLPLPQPLDALGIHPRWPELVAELEKCEFKSLLAEVKAEAGAAGVITAPATPPVTVATVASAALPAPPSAASHSQGELF